MGLLVVALSAQREAAELALHSMSAQATFLERHLEWDIGGNHLLENARALLLAGAMLDGPDADRWLRKGADLLRSQLAEQLLPHGEHFERSPMYHARMLEVVLDARDATIDLAERAESGEQGAGSREQGAGSREQGAGRGEGTVPFFQEFAEFCHQTATRMATFMQAILHPDDGIPLLGDSCFDDCPPPRQLLERAVVLERAGTGPFFGDKTLSANQRRPENMDLSPCVAQAGQAGDYWVYRSGRDLLVFDAGPVGPDHLPAHAHADLLTFEASWNGQRLFVDSGVFNYQDDAMRQYCRSTAAHNVLQIDDQNQCDVWSRFRMGRRGWPGGLAMGQSDGFFWARSWHNAYRRPGVPRVGRDLACRPGGPWFCVDWAHGKGTRRLTQRLHLHPQVRASLVSPEEIELCCGDAVLRLHFLAPGEITIDRAWYCPEFGVKIESPVVRWTAKSPLPAVTGWCLVPRSNQGRASLLAEDDGRWSLCWEEAGQAISLP